MKSVMYFISMAFAATALLAACGKSGGTTASVPNNCSVNQGYSATAGCVTITSCSVGSVGGVGYGYGSTGYNTGYNGQVTGITSAGRCVPVDCVNNGSGCVAVGTSGYYNNGAYTNGSYYTGYSGGYGVNGYGYGSGYGGYPVVGSSFYPTSYGYSYPSYGYSNYGGYGGYGGYGYPSYGSSYGISAGIYVHL